MGVVRTDTASSQQVAAVLKAKTKSRRSQRFETLFPGTEDSHLREAGKEQFHQILRACMTVQTCAAGDVHVAQWLFAKLREKDLSSLF